MKKVVVTGSTGFIGLHLVRRLIEKGCRVTAVARPGSRNIKKLPSSPLLEVAEFDMSDYGRLPGSIKNADAFYHLAWNGTRGADRDDWIMQRENYLCSLKAFEAAGKMGAKIFLAVGSQAECGFTDGAPADENYPCKPGSRYGKAKLALFEKLSDLARDGDMKFVWARVFSLYGAGDYRGTLVTGCVSALMRKKVVPTTRATQLWDYLNVHDAVNAMTAFLDKDAPGGLYNFARGDSHPLKYYIEIIKNVVDPGGIIDYGRIPYGERVVQLNPSCEKLKRALDWRPLVSFEDGVREILESLEKEESIN